MKNKYWKISNKIYDFSNFINNHPGVKDVLLMTKGKDCTELFYSSHSISKKSNYIFDQIKNYEIEIDAKNSENMFIMKNYLVLSEKVKKVIKTNNYKAPKEWFVLFSFLIISYLWMLTKQNIFSSFLSGILLMNIFFFGAIHDASHYALFKSSKNNILFTKFFTSFGLWDYKLWFQHHVYMHHSYTNTQKDPDISHSPLIRKSQDQKHKWYHSFQHLYAYLHFLALPGQYFGQVYAYMFSLATKCTLFTKQVIAEFDYFETIIKLFSILFHYVIFKNHCNHFIAYCSGISTSYFFFVVVNHDSVINPIYSNCWLKHQVENSRNFSNNNILLTLFCGGMNYQIEHHLFPTICNYHYPVISPIVKKFCKENNINYVCYNNWFEGIKDVAYNYYVNSINIFSQENQNYTGIVTHKRLKTKIKKGFSFKYKVSLDYFNLQNPPKGFFCYYDRNDHIGDKNVDLYTYIKNKIYNSEGLKYIKINKIYSLGNIRSYWCCFNPIVLHYCYYNNILTCIFAEVSNIPWGEKTSYILPIEHNKIKEGYQIQNKKMHVSPFNPHNNQFYYFTVNLKKDDVIDFNISVFNKTKENDYQLSRKDLVINTSLKLKKKFPSIFRMPRNQLTILRIHWQAFLLWLNKFKLYYHPKHLK